MSSIELEKSQQFSASEQSAFFHILLTGSAQHMKIRAMRKPETFHNNLVMDITSLFTLRNQNRSIGRVAPRAGIFSSSGAGRQFDLFTERLSSNITFVRSFIRSSARSYLVEGALKASFPDCCVRHAHGDAHFSLDFVHLITQPAVSLDFKNATCRADKYSLNQEIRLGAD